MRSWTIDPDTQTQLGPLLERIQRDYAGVLPASRVVDAVTRSARALSRLGARGDELLELTEHTVRQTLIEQIADKHARAP